MEQLMESEDKKAMNNAILTFLSTEMANGNPHVFAKEMRMTLDPMHQDEEPLNVGKAKDLLEHLGDWLASNPTDNASLANLKSYLGLACDHCHNEYHSRVMHQLGTMKTLMPLYDYLANLSRKADELCDKDDPEVLFECKAVLLYSFCELLMSQSVGLDIVQGDRGGSTSFSTWVMQRLRETKNEAYKYLMLNILAKYIYAANDVLPFDDLPEYFVENFKSDPIEIVTVCKIPNADAIFMRRSFPGIMLIDKAFLVCLTSSPMRLRMIELGLPSKLEAVERWVSTLQGDDFETLLTIKFVKMVRGLINDDHFVDHVANKRATGPLPPQAVLREPSVLACSACATPSSEDLRLKKCACEKTWYCSDQCQKAHWKTHKKECGARK
jgi:hypothetical protein